MREAVNVGLRIDFHEIRHHGRRDLRPPPTAAGERKEEQGPVSDADQTIRAVCQHHFQRIAGEGGLGGSR